MRRKTLKLTENNRLEIADIMLAGAPNSLSPEDGYRFFLAGDWKWVATIDSEWAIHEMWNVDSIIHMTIKET